MCERWLYPCYVLCLGLGDNMCERWLYPCYVLCLGLGGTCVNVGCFPVMFSV